MFALAHLPALRFVERRPQIAAWRRATRPHISKISIPSVRPMVRAVEGTVDGSGRDIPSYSQNTGSGAGASAPKGGQSRKTGSCGSQWGEPGRVALAARTPDSLYSLEAIPNMSNHNLTYSISKRTPAPPKAVKEILDAQAALNRACTWTHERLAFAPPRDAGHAAFPLQLVRFGLASGNPPALDGFGVHSPTPPADAFMHGSTRVRDNLWNAHLVVAFLKLISRKHPSLLFELRDDGGFVVPGSVWIRAGAVEVNREFLNAERVRALEVTGDPQAAVPYVWAELQALGGSFFAEASMDDFGNMPEVRELGASWDQLESMSIEDLASLVVDHATAEAVPVAA